MTEVANDFNEILFWMVTACGFIGAFIPFLVKMVLQIITRETEMESNLRRQVCDLKAELGGISMVDEFAKYAKIQRKINKAADELANQSRVRSTYTMRVRMVATSALYLIMSITVSVLLWKYSNVAVVTLPEHWVYPIGSLLAFPSSVPGGISLTTWLFACTTVGRILAAHIS